MPQFVQWDSAYVIILSYYADRQNIDLQVKHVRLPAAIISAMLFYFSSYFMNDPLFSDLGRDKMTSCQFGSWKRVVVVSYGCQAPPTFTASHPRVPPLSPTSEEEPLAPRVPNCVYGSELNVDNGGY